MNRFNYDDRIIITGGTNFGRSAIIKYIFNFDFENHYLVCNFYENRDFILYLNESEITIDKKWLRKNNIKLLLNNER